MIQAQSKQIEELIAENENLKETIAQLESKVQYYQDSYVSKESLSRLESKIRDLESRLDLEEMTRQRAEVCNKNRNNSIPPSAHPSGLNHGVSALSIGCYCPDR